jgi:hypothetical protein
MTSCNFLQNHFLDEEVNLIKKTTWQYSTGCQGPPGQMCKYLFKGSSSSTTRRPWSSVAFEGLLFISWHQDFGLNLWLQAL